MKINLCRFGWHKWVYANWPQHLPKWFVLGAPWAGRRCKKCRKTQIPEHNAAYEYFGQWHWMTQRK